LSSSTQIRCGKDVKQYDILYNPTTKIDLTTTFTIYPKRKMFTITIIGRIVTWIVIVSIIEEDGYLASWKQYQPL